MASYSVASIVRSGYQWDQLKEPVKQMVRTELTQRELQDVLACIESSQKELKSGSWYEKVKEKFPAIPIEKESASLNIFLRELVVEKNKSLQSYVSALSYSGLSPRSAEPLEQYTNLEYILSKIYDKSPVFALLHMKVSPFMQFEHDRLVTRRLEKELTENAHLQIVSPTQKPVTMSDEAVKKVVDWLTHYKFKKDVSYSFTLKNITLDSEQLAKLRDISGKVNMNFLIL